MYIPLSAPEWDPTPCRCWGQVSLKIEETIAKLVGETVSYFRNVILSFCMYPFPRIWAIVLWPRIRSPYESNFPWAPTHSRGVVEGRLVFVIVAPSVVSATGGAKLTSLASMARVTCSVSLLMGTFEWNSGPSFVTGSAVTPQNFWFWVVHRKH